MASASAGGNGVAGTGTTGCHIACGAFGGEQPLVRFRQLSGRELHGEPAREVVCPGGDGAGGPDVRAERDLLLVEGLLRPDATQFAHPAVREGAIRRGQPVDVVRDTRLHADRREDPCLYEIFPGLAGNGLDQLARHRIQDVVVGETRAKARRGLQETDASHEVGAADPGRRHEHQVALAAAEAAAVHEQVAHRDLARDPGVVHSKVGEVIDDAVVPADLAFLDQDRERRGRKSLGRRADLEQRVGADGLRRAQLAHAVTAGEGHLAVLHDRDGGSRYF